MAEARKKPLPASARQNMAAVVNEGLTKRRLKQFLDMALEATVPVDAECPDCGSQMRAKAPDVKKQLDVLVGMLEQAEGRPEQRAPGELSVVIERPPR